MNIYKKVTSKILNTYYGIIPEKAFAKSPTSEKDLANYASVLKLEMSKINPQAVNEKESAWEENMHQLRSLVASEENPINFNQWKVIKNTMFHSPSRVELIDLKRSKYWNDFKPALIETVVGNSPHYYYYSQSSGNLIHHGYNLLQLLKAFSPELSKLNSIIEFGGGYGNTCKLLYSMGFNGSYSIFDLPEFTALQRYFLSAVGLFENKKISLSSDLQDIRNTMNPDLFIATWSLSESPVSLRESFLNKIGKPKYILIAYQEKFSNIDNVAYFKEFKGKFSGYEWKEYPIEHLKGNRYLVGKKL